MARRLVAVKPKLWFSHPEVCCRRGCIVDGRCVWHTRAAVADCLVFKLVFSHSRFSGLACVGTA